MRLRARTCKLDDEENELISSRTCSQEDIAVKSLFECECTVS